MAKDVQQAVPGSKKKGEKSEDRRPERDGFFFAFRVPEKSGRITRPSASFYEREVFLLPKVKDNGI
jgi:hypothetical protein